MKPQTTRLVAYTLAVIAAGIVALFYVTRVSHVHEAARPVALAKLQPDKSPAAVPAVAFVDANGGMHRLSDYRGRYLLLNLWATWCAPCVKELPALSGLKQAMGNRKLAVVAVDVGRDSADEAGKFLKSHHADELTVYRDTNAAFLHAFGAYGLPLTVLIDPQGREVARAVGAVSWNDKSAVAWFRDLASGSKRI
jgi:thiol-disulfide isomerase/thioredoxin